MSHPEPALPLAGARILVLGAGTRIVPQLEDLPVGNGRAIAQLAARQGARVVCSDVVEEAAAETARLITEDGGEAHVSVGDVGDPERCEALVREAAETLGGLDGIVVNPGIGWGLAVAGTSVSDWDAVMGVNLRAPFVATKTALELMGSTGSVVLIGSVAGQMAGSGIPTYDTSKAGLHGLCRAAAVEAAPEGKRVNVVAPGLIDTVLGRLATIVNPGRDNDARIPMRRQGTAWEVAEVVTFLLSQKASYVTGQVITVDGGLSAGF